MNNRSDFITIKDIISTSALIGSYKLQKLSCAKHGEYDSISRDNRPFSTCFECQEEIDRKENHFAELRQKQSYKQKKIEESLASCAIKERFKDCTFENYLANTNIKKTIKEKIIEFANNFSSNGRSGIFHGHKGNGKTHLAAAVLKTVINNGYTGFYVRLSEMLKDIGCSSYNKPDRIKKYCIPDLLVIDEASFSLEDKEKIDFFDVIDNRYMDKKSTIFISNLTDLETSSVIGEKIIDRIKEDDGIILYFNWESYRC